jgi:hypothetical protein
MPFSAARLRRIGLSEVAWRLREQLDIASARVATAVVPSRWDRRQLARALNGHDDFDRVRSALRAERWQDAHAMLGAYFCAAPARFVIAPSMRQPLADIIAARCPQSVRDSRARADRIVSGRYDLLGYQDLAFDGRSWHTDVVHGKSAPVQFWSTVPYLDPESGDHKVTWEFNRHQHWLELGRAYWLTSDSRYRTECITQLRSWMDSNPPLMGMNWASMRALSWIWAVNFFAEGAGADDTPWLVDLLLGLDRQLTHIERHLSYYFSPNTHLTGEALALYVCGRVLPCLGSSARREAIGRRVLAQEIGRQIGADGGHCERSTHYHRYTLDFYLLALAVARLTNDPVASVFERACGRLAHFARAIADDAGRLPRLGDDDGGSLLPLTRRPPDDARDSLAIAAALLGHLDLMVGDTPEEVWWVLGHRGFADTVARMERAPRSAAATSTALPATGYFVSRNAHGDHIVVDGGAHGYLNAGHAHADALSVTLTYRHQPLLIDVGTGCYTIDARVRDRFRSSDLHNTLTLNARSQSIPRGPFHWQHTANATVRRWRTNRQFDYFCGTHDGYAPLAHCRHVFVLHGDLVVVADAVVSGPENERGSAAGNVAHDVHDATVHWHVDPSWTVDQHVCGARLLRESTSVELQVAGAEVEHFREDHSLALGWHSPGYGRIEPTSTIRLRARGRVPLWLVSVFGLDASNRVRAVTLEPVETDGPSMHYIAGIRIDRDESIDRVVIAEPLDDRGHGEWRHADFDTDARLLYTRETGSQLTALAAVDVSALRSTRYAHVRRACKPRLTDLYLTSDSLCAEPWSPGADKRKAS